MVVGSSPKCGLTQLQRLRTIAPEENPVSLSSSDLDLDAFFAVLSGLVKGMFTLPTCFSEDALHKNHFHPGRDWCIIPSVRLQANRDLALTTQVSEIVKERPRRIPG